MSISDAAGPYWEVLAHLHSVGGGDVFLFSDYILYSGGRFKHVDSST